MKTDDPLLSRARVLFEDLHRHPELSWNEHRTSGKVREFLVAHGVTVQDSQASPGLIVDIDGGTPGNRVFLRGDMDALPIEEETDLPYSSTKTGVMHACGHDFHTTTLATIAAYLHQHRDELAGSFRLAFQPAEEIQPSGAEAMVKNGEADGFDAFVALHCDPLIPLGQVGYRHGPINAAVDTLMIKIIGQGGHGSRPHLAVDPVRIGCLLVTELHHLVGREVSAHDPTVLTMTVFHAGDAHNIIPDEAALKGTLRSYSPGPRAEMKQAIHRVCEGVAHAHGAKIQVDLRDGHSNVINDPTLVHMLEESVRDSYGNDALFEMPVPTLGGDDFACYGEKGPQLLFRLGVGDPKAKPEDLHSPRFIARPEALPIGFQVLSKVAIRAGAGVKSP